MDMGRLASIKFRDSLRDTVIEDRRDALADLLLDASYKVECAKRTSPSKAIGEDSFWPEPEVWPDPVVGTALLDEIVEALSRYVVAGDDEIVAIALWVVLAHCVEAVDTLPILALESPTKACGKTRTLEVIAALVPKPLTTSNISMASVFRAVEKWAPTLLIDEADTFLAEHDEMRGIINSGHTRLGAYVVRVDGDEYEPRRFSTWTPKVIALIGRLPDTTRSRAIVISMRRKRPDETIERWRALRSAQEMQGLRSRIVRWAADHVESLAEAEPVVPDGIEDRDADNWRPLLSIAEGAGGEWPKHARKACEHLCSAPVDDTETPGVLLLHDLHTIFERLGKDQLATPDIVQELVGLEDRPWPEWRRGKPLTGRSLAKLLRAFEVKPGKWRDGDLSVRGYKRASFEDAWARYPSPLSPATSATTIQDNDLHENQSATKGDYVAGSESRKVLSDNDVAGVAGGSGGSLEADRYEVEERIAIQEEQENTA